MVTKQDMDNILVQVNAILERLNKRVTALEEATKKSTTTKTTRSQEKT